jgi:hypothetical protein
LLSDSDDEQDVASTSDLHHKHRIAWPAVVLYLILCLLVVLLLSLAALHFAIGRTMRQIDLHGGYQAFAEKTLLYELQGVRLDGVQDDTIAFRVQATAGVDVARGLDWQDDTVFGRWQRRVTRWAVKRAKHADVELAQDGMLLQWQAANLLSIHPQEPLSLPVKYGAEGKDWLQAIDMPVKIKIISADALAAMAKQAYQANETAVDARVPSVTVRTGWRVGFISLQDLSRHVHIDGKLALVSRMC